MMVTDHTQAGAKMSALASQHNLTMPAAADAEKNPAEAFADKRGADFDREYADTMVDAHQDMVDKLESRIDKETLAKWKENHTNPATGQKGKVEAMTVVAEKSDNPVTLALNQWAAETYPVAFAHLQAAKDLQKGLESRRSNP
jgi:putative membrane protein